MTEDTGNEVELEPTEHHQLSVDDTVPSSSRQSGKMIKRGNCDGFFLYCQIFSYLYVITESVLAAHLYHFVFNGYYGILSVR